MHAFRSGCLAVLLLLLWEVAATAVDPRNADILGLRLGMTRTEVVARLVAQGIDRPLIRDERDPCPGNPAAGCVDQLTAPTRDGRLVIRFVARPDTGQDAVWSIAYTLYGRLPGEPAIIHDAMLEHFGPPPGGTDPAVWCAHVAGAVCSPADQPQIIFGQGPSTSSTLTIIDPTAVVRTAP